VTSLVAKIARFCANEITIWRNISLSGFALGISVAAVQIWQYPKYVIYFSLSLLFILLFIQKISEKIAAVNVLLEIPGSPRTQGNDEFTIKDNNLRLRCSAIVPQRAEKPIIEFKEGEGYGVILSNYPEGVEPLNPNEIRVGDGVSDFDFTAAISKETSGGSFTMDIRDNKTDSNIKTVKLDFKQ
jgi:hypothetical protein